MSTRSRNGIRNPPLSHNRHCTRYGTKMLGGSRRPDFLALACKAINQALRIQKRLAKEHPHIYGPHSRQYFLDTLQMEREREERKAALCSVYGPPKPGEPGSVSTLWTDRYHPPEDPKLRRVFFKWFHEKYGRSSM